MARRMEEVYVGLPPGSLEDRALTLAYQQGDEAAYDVIYDRYAQRVHNVCRRMLPNQQDAQDATQETFLRVHQALGRFNGRYQLGAWITRIATNVCLDQIRAKTRRPLTAMSLDDSELEGAEDAEVDGPHEIVIRRYEGRRVRKVLASLPPMHRAAIVLRDFEGLSYSEVAVVLGISEPQVKALIHRARQGFKRSWTLPLSALLPARFLPRFRKVDAPAKEQTSHTVGSVQQLAETVSAAAAPAASSCSALAQCGSFVAERLAPALAAVAVGAASLAGPVAARDAVKQSAPARTLADDEFAKSASSILSPSGEATRVEQPEEVPQSPAAVDNEERSEAAPEPAASPSPGPSPSPSPPPPAPSGDGSGTTAPSGASTPSPPSPSPSPTPSPAPFTAAVGWDYGSGVTAREPKSNQVLVGCASRRFEQTLTTEVVVGSSLYPATLRLNATSSGGQLDLTVVKDGREYVYRSWGTEPAVAWSDEAQSANLRMAGDYGPVYGSEPEKAGLPGAGSFEVNLRLACSASSVTTESVVFTTR